VYTNPPPLVLIFTVFSLSLVSGACRDLRKVQFRGCQELPTRQ
jgi:hypothetical protein